MTLGLVVGAKNIPLGEMTVLSSSSGGRPTVVVVSLALLRLLVLGADFRVSVDFRLFKLRMPSSFLMGFFSRADSGLPRSMLLCTAFEYGEFGVDGVGGTEDALLGNCVVEALLLPLFLRDLVINGELGVLPLKLVEVLRMFSWLLALDKMHSFDVRFGLAPP